MHIFKGPVLCKNHCWCFFFWQWGVSSLSVKCPELGKAHPLLFLAPLFRRCLFLKKKKNPIERYWAFFSLLFIIKSTSVCIRTMHQYFFTSSLFNSLLIDANILKVLLQSRSSHKHSQTLCFSCRWFFFFFKHRIFDCRQIYYLVHGQLRV